MGDPAIGWIAAIIIGGTITGAAFSDAVALIWESERPHGGCRMREETRHVPTGMPGSIAP